MVQKNYDKAKERMINRHLIARGIRDERVLEAMKKIPRERFVPEDMKNMAYDDSPLPIGHNQTISQPFIVAEMTQALGLKGDEKVLEIGTGCGYQAAILGLLAKTVYTVERIEALAVRAKQVLADLEMNNVFYKIYDGTMGWEAHKLYDGIIVTAGAPEIPPSLLEQLADQGRMVIPVGDRFSQMLFKITKKNGNILQEELGACRFVPLKGEQGW